MDFFDVEEFLRNLEFNKYFPQYLGCETVSTSQNEFEKFTSVHPRHFT